MDTTTLLVIVIVLVILGGGGWYGRVFAVTLGVASLIPMSRRVLLNTGMAQIGP